ncbi:nucleotide disphospho-sugar-binding domain-containing protein [Nocardia sp. NPDC046473]|uniref:nucleotide disphospho-sugar-binding domain-containing protein n=1 Tax=Nocardia sp. NPDC046473 TaxID=3155733 RepID=UPI0033F3BDA8
MRVMITCCPATSHLYPMVPLAWGLRAAGHEVLVVAPENLKNPVVQAGLAFASSCHPITIVAAMLDGRAQSGPLQPSDLAISDEAMGEGFARLAQTVLPGSAGLAEEWRPDLIITEPTALDGAVVAAEFGIPLIEHRWSLPVSPEIVSSAKRSLVAAGRLDDNADLAPALNIDVCPPSFHQAPPSSTTVSVRYVPYNGAAVYESWMSDKSQRPRVCVTLGTILPNLPWAAAVMRSMLDGLSELSVDVVVAMDPSSWKRVSDEVEVSPNVFVTSWVPLGLLLPSCRAIIHHGGAGTTMTSLVHGVPQLILPQFADQFANAQRIAACGSGVDLAPTMVSKEFLPDLVDSLLSEGSPMRDRAAEIAVEAQSQIPPSSLIPTLEEVARSITTAPVR